MPYDFMPARSEHGGHNIVMSGVMNAAEAFTVGDVVFRNNDGEIEQAPIDASPFVVGDMDSGRIWGVAANPGVDPSTNTALINPHTGVAYTTGDQILFWPADHHIIFKTKNVVTAANTPVTPTGVMVGEAVAIIFDNTAGVVKWCLDVDTAPGVADPAAVIHGVLDSRGKRISATDTTTGVWVLFELKTAVGLVS